MLDAVPLGGAGWQVGHRYLQAGLIGEALQFSLPQPDPNAVGPAAIGGDGQTVRSGITRLAQLLPPTPDAFHREGRSVGIDTNTDPAVIGRDVIHTIRGHLAELRQLEVVHPHRLRILLTTQLPARVLEIANQLLLLRIHRDCRLIVRNGCLHRCIDVRELGIPIRAVAPFARLAIGLATVFLRPQQLSHQPLADLETLGNQRLDQMALAAADPAQRRARITADRILDQCLKRRRQPWLMHNRRLAPAPRTAGRRTDPVAAGAQLGNPSVDGTAGNPGGPCRRAHTPIALGQGLVRREQAPSPFAEEVLKQPIPGSDVLNVDHALRLFPPRRVAPSKFVILSLRSSGQLDSFISPRILSRAHWLARRGGACDAKVLLLATLQCTGRLATLAARPVHARDYLMTNPSLPDRRSDLHDLWSAAMLSWPTEAGGAV